MGRPIKRKFFGVDNVNDSLTYSDAGGEGISSFTYTNRGTYYSQGLTATVPASIGTQAILAPVVSTANGRVDSVTITTAGTGYTTAPTITFTKPGNVTTTGTTYYPAEANITVASTTGIYVGMIANIGFSDTTTVTAVDSATGNVTMSGANNAARSSGGIVFFDRGASVNISAVLAAVYTTANTIQANAWTTSGTIGSQADIVSQRSSRRYRVTTTAETSVCRLVPSMLNTPTAATVTAAGGPTAAGEMTIEASDSDSGTYWVVKLDSRTATIVPGGTGTPGSQFAANAQVRWTSTSTAVENVSVKIATND